MSGSIVAPSLTPRPAQRAAVSAILDVLSRGSRTQLHFPCGTGKTVVSAFVAQGLDTRRIAVLVPSIDLVSRQRWLYGQGRLDPQVRVVLEQVPGWSWNRRAVRLSEAATTPVQLPSHIAHGDRRGTSVYRCHCVECLATTREISTERFRARQAQVTAHYVHAPEAARAARRLLGVVPGASLAAVAAAAGMPTALLARLQSDPQTPIPPRLARRLSQLTASEVARWVRPGTRGRTASRAAEPADPVRCQQLLRMLQEAGLTKAQIAGELGHANSSSPNLVQRSNPRPTAAAQHALECLARDLGKGGVEDNLAAKEWSA